MTTPTQEAYGLAISTPLPYAEAVEATKAALAAVGFGVLWEINVPETLKAKIGVDDFHPYLILGTCNPALAHRGLTAELTWASSSPATSWSTTPATAAPP